MIGGTLVDYMYFKETKTAHVLVKDNDYTDTVIVKFEIEPHIEGGIEAGASVWWHGDWVFTQLYGVEHETKFKKKAFTYGDEKVFYERFKGTLK